MNRDDTFFWGCLIFAQLSVIYLVVLGRKGWKS